MRCSVIASLPRSFCFSPHLPSISRVQHYPLLQRLGSGAVPSLRYASSSSINRIDVAVGGNGHVSLSVIQPTISSSRTRRNVIIQLPPGPLFRESYLGEGNAPFSQGTESGSLTAHYGDVEDPASACRLANLTSATVVTINYRLGPVPFTRAQLPSNPKPDTQTSDLQRYFQFPTPIHDTLAGFDWALQALQPTHLGIIGSHIGGSLALMLALTEPHSIHAVAALEPVCDWTSLDEYCRTPSLQNRPKRKTQPSHASQDPEAPWDLVPLLTARRTLFTTPERYFDAFASPLLFLRSAGKDAPTQFPSYLTGPEYPTPVLENEDLVTGRPTGFESEPEPESKSSESDSYPDSEFSAEYPPGESPPPIRRRKALSRWPPYGLDYGVSGSSTSSYRHQNVKRLEVVLPHVRVFTRGDSEELPPPPPASSSKHQDDGSGDGIEQAVKRLSSRKNKKHQTTVLSQQAGDMVDVMRRACFWGREKGFGEERVTLAVVPDLDGRWPESGIIDAGEWMRGVLDS